MSSPIPIRYHSRSDASSPSSPGLYVPVHRRTPRSYTSTSSRTPSPSPSSSRALSPSPFPSSSPSPTSTRSTLPTPTPSIPGIYTPAELLLLWTSPLAKLDAGHLDALRVLVPEVVQTRKQRKAMAWHTRHPSTTDSPRSHKQPSPRGSHAHASESEEDRATTWRRI